jgi:type IV secretory pathway VirB4 component
VRNFVAELRSAPNGPGSLRPRNLLHRVARLSQWQRAWELQPPVPVHRATTANLRAVQAQAATSFGTRGVYIGLNLSNGTAFTYDPWELYGRQLHDANVAILGAIGKAKSSLVKTYLLRQQVFGRRALVLSPKPDEYDRFAAVCGITPIRVYPGGPWRLNPLDVEVPSDNRYTTTRTEQLRVLRALAEATLGRTLSPDERNAIRAALDAAAPHRETGQLTLPQVVERLLWPTAAMAEASGAALHELRGEARPVGLALSDLVGGALGGMFDAPTSSQLDLNAHAVVFDLARLRGSEALGMLMTCMSATLTNHLLSSAGGGPRPPNFVGPGPTEHAQEPRQSLGPRNTIMVLEEAWAVLGDLGMARYFQSLAKLSRQMGLQNIFVLHRLSDLEAVGAEGSEQVKLARGLIADCGTKVIYGQPDSELDTTQALLQLGDAQRAMLRGLPRGQALWIIGDARRSAIVEHVLSPTEHDIVDTDQAMVRTWSTP